MQNRFLTGVVEGFYGRSWPMQVRHDYGDYLSALGLNTYIYAPKGDACLRRRWGDSWPGPQRQQLRELAGRYRDLGLEFGVGLSPFALYRDYGPGERERLRQKVREIDGLGVSLLSILFDDMPGDLDGLAGRQAEIVADICAWAPHLRVQVCPTYYSFDPVLEKYFGSMPQGYWSELGASLSPQVDVYWTGNQVCADAVTSADIAAIMRELGRPVMLWDNYPVNDGAIRSRRLYCQPLAQRDAALAKQLTGHLCNPMNQALLSLPALTGLAALYGSGPEPGLVGRILGDETWQLLQQYRQLFREEGLDGLENGRREALAQEFEAVSSPAAMEVAGWLRGEYTFDPACLTD